MMIESTQTEREEARLMAEAVNGGSWDVDYSDSQKSSWILKARLAARRRAAKASKED